MRLMLATLAAASALALALPVDSPARTSLAQQRAVKDTLARDQRGFEAKAEAEAKAELVQTNVVDARGASDTAAKGEEAAKNAGANAAAAVGAESAESKDQVAETSAGATNKKKNSPFEVFANAAAGKHTHGPSMNDMMVLGPHGLQAQIAEQEAEDQEEKEQAGRPYWLQVVHDMLAPLRLPVIRGHPPALLQARDGENGRPRWRFLPATSFTHLPKTMATRLSVQDMAVLMAVVIFYLSTIMIALSLVYHSSAVSSGVKWFCEPELYTCASKSFFDFMATFNRPPETRVRVLVTNRSNTRKRLDLMLDVTPLCGEGPHAATMSGKDATSVREYMESKGALATLIIQKNVVWEGFESLREMIEKRVHDQGFEGQVRVTLERSRDVAVRRNTQLFHFVHSQITLILVLMSIVGLFLFWPLVWMRRKTWYVTSTFVIDAPPEDYMQLVEQALPDACTHAEESDAPTTAGGRGAGGDTSSDSSSRRASTRRARWPRSQGRMQPAADSLSD